MNATERQRRRWPRSTRVRAALAAASAVAVILVGTGWWVHHDVRRQSTHIVEEQARAQRDYLCDQVSRGVVPSSESAVPFEVVATDRRTSVARGGFLATSYPETSHVLPAPSKSGEPPWKMPVTVHLPVNRNHSAKDSLSAAGGTQQAMTCDIDAAELSGDKAAALGVTADARLRVYVMVLPQATELLTEAADRRLWPAGLVILVLVAAITYLAVRIALRPVEAIRVLTASVTASDERVIVPASGREIAALATTINSTLQRLDNAALQQRRFVADAAHELRSPLTTLLASLEVALAYPERADWPATATTAARQTRRLQALAEDLLLLARLDTRTPTTATEPVDLTALATRLTDHHPLADGPLTLSCDSTGPAFAHGNPDEYERLLRNLVDNAARHAAHRVQITVRGEKDHVVLTVHDDGPGIPPEDAERVFERFVRLDDARSRDQGGTGLGLAIARDLAHRHGGTLTLAPRTLGACFELRVPRAPDPDSGVG
ncbi:HAMP domain-containing sensor histidine kinase [Streptomyces sp. NPDC004539]|uniref:sensor histidine kinase n=1 Tax=Streptomyces sp. NPDC004539 TaxID=3154280 RepID=UPI0033BEAE3F